MNVDVFAGLSAAAEFAGESSFLANHFDRLADQKRRLARARLSNPVLFGPIELGDVSTDQVLRRKPLSIFTPVTTGDHSMKVGGEHQHPLLHLVHHSRLKARLRNDPTRLD